MWFPMSSVPFPDCPGTEIAEEVSQDMHRRTDGLLGAHIWWGHISPCTYFLPCQAAQMLSAKAVSAAWGCLLLAFQQFSIVLAPDAEVPAPGSPWDSWCIPRQLKMVVCWQISGLGKGRVGSLKTLCVTSEIYGASNLPQHTFNHPPGIRLSFDSVLK